MPFLRRAPLVTTTIDLYEGSRAAVVITPDRKRWPELEETDRLVVPLGLAALALARAPDIAIEAVRDRLRHAADAIADPSLVGELASTLCIAVAGLELAEPDSPGATRISAQLIRSAVGPIPTIGRASHGSRTLASAGAAALAVSLTPVGLDVRLAAALSLEGLLGWYAIADPQLQPPQQAIAYALRHAAARLTEAGRTAPGALAVAVHEHRKISPMAGGA